ncbi:MAG: 2-amino-4-hydroxy-6-hydroxymethyldihydropteridine diphosphokinase [Gammaproteobacteria bacterium]|nr:2-amino-4-hydroxy-6-hydroxymethyldihydropteridine diphosphokinase [Gammaproteobacteria bacterium]NNF60284.1 2-amino-4-hydroxy-6-hydroxymethyldihydropteridine diphosphokinase [Gammaproteobacteria bacterium]NNM20392.1 2-amino-4-hydroxy-6-hydroxymethyldihydropteridine diphosphokinase [Gammaproteobacteria bacterium]
MQAERWLPAYIALGSNLDDPQQQVARALSALAGLEQTVLAAQSSLYISAPLGPAEQPDYVNAVAAMLTQQAPLSLMTALLAIEKQHGRIRGTEKWGPRTIDLDLLLYGDTVREGEELTLPHPRMCERVFVLQPLTELAPALRLPDGRRVASVLRHLDSTGLRRL